MSSRFFYTNQNSNCTFRIPTENDFELVKVDNPDLKDGEFLIHDLWMSVDPPYAWAPHEGN